MWIRITVAGGTSEKTGTKWVLTWLDSGCIYMHYPPLGQHVIYVEQVEGRYTYIRTYTLVLNSRFHCC